MTAPADPTPLQVAIRAQIAAAMPQLIEVRGATFVDAGTATRPADVGQTPTLDADGNVVTPAATQVYTGVCTISDPTSARQSDRTSNDQAGVPATRFLKVPHAADLRPGDLFTVTASAFSPGMVGDTFVVLGEEERSYATYRRYQLRGSSWLAG